MRHNTYTRAIAISALVVAFALARPALADPIGPLLPTTGGQVFKSYEVYKDASDPNVFYALRTQPVLATAQNGGAVFSMEKFDGETANFGGTLTATVSLENNGSDFDGPWAGKDIRSMTFVSDPLDETYVEIRDNNGNRERMYLEATTDAQNRISFHLPLTPSQAERIWQTHTGNTLPVTLFLKRHILAVTTDLQVDVKIDMHEIYKYFSANASVGFWIFKASYKQVRESHNIDNFIHVTTFIGEGVSDEKLAAAQEEAWKRIREILFRQTITPNPAPSPPLSGWPADVLAVANDFYNNYKLATGSGYLTAEVVDIQKTFDAHYEYQIDQKRAERRARNFFYDVDISSLQAHPERYFFLVQHYPATRDIVVSALPGLGAAGASKITTTIWQETPLGAAVGTQSLKFRPNGGGQFPSQSATIRPAVTQTLAYKTQTKVGLPDQELTGPVDTNAVGEDNITVPNRAADFYAKKIVELLTDGKQVTVQRADLAVTFTRKSDGTTMTNLISASRINGAGAKVMVNSLNLTIWDCDDLKPVSYELSAISKAGKFISAGLPNVQARAIVQLKPRETQVIPNEYAVMIKGLKSTPSPLRKDLLMEQSLGAPRPTLVFTSE